MGTTRQRSGAALHEVRLDLLLGSDDVTYLRGTAGPDATPVASADPLAPFVVQAAIDWAVRTASSDAGWSRRQVAGHLERACASADAAEYAARCGNRAVAFEAPPVGTLGPTVSLELRLGDGVPGPLHWNVPRAAGGVSEAARVLATWWSVADFLGAGPVVHHALYALRGGFERSGVFASSVRAELGGSLMTFAVGMAEADEHAASSRRALHVVEDGSRP